MQTYSIFTWNTQGDFTKDVKLQVINGLYPSGCVVGCIQEGGVEKHGTHGRWFAYAGPQIGSKNERCTNYILVDATYSKFVDVSSLNISNGRGALVVGGGLAGRSPAAIAMNGILFISWHSLAGQSNTDTSLLIAAIESNNVYTNMFHTVVIGGDFNASPTDIRQLINRGTIRTKSFWKYNYRDVINSGNATHSSNKELDFFVILSKTQWIQKGILSNLKMIEMKAVVPSDHNPVRMQILI